MGCSSGPDIIQDGLVLCLDAASIRSYPKSGTTWSDLAGANDGTLNNMQDNFRNDGAGSLIFDGGDEYISSIGNNSTFSFIQNTAEFSVSSYVKFNALNRINPISISTTATAEKGYYFRVESDNKITLAARLGVSGASVFGIRSNQTVSSDEWINIVGVGDGSIIKLYINGVESSIAGNPSASVGTLSTGDSTRTLTLGTNPVGAGQYLAGNIASFFIYNRPLTADEVRQNYLSTKERFA